MNYQRVLNIILLIVVAGLVVLLFRAQPAKAGPAHDLAAYFAVPHCGADYVAVEVSPFVTINKNEDEGFQSITGEATTHGVVGGIAGGMNKFCIGGGFVHAWNVPSFTDIGDRDFMEGSYSDDTQNIAGAISLPLGEYTSLKVGAGTSLSDNNGSQLTRWTIAATLRIGL